MLKLIKTIKYFMISYMRRQTNGLNISLEVYRSIKMYQSQIILISPIPNVGLVKNDVVHSILVI